MLTDKKTCRAYNNQEQSVQSSDKNTDMQEVYWS